MRRSVDWVVQPETWRNGVAGMPWTAASVIMSNNTQRFFPLTVWEYNLIDAGASLSVGERFREKNEQMSHVRTKGVVHCLLWPSSATGAYTQIFTRNFWIQIQMRIVIQPIMVSNVTGQFESGTPASYDLREPQTANEQFLWHREHTIFNVGTDEWAGTPAVRCQPKFSVPIDCRVQRRIDVLEAAWLVVQLTDVDQVLNDTYPMLDDYSDRLVVQPHVRTLVM